MFSIRGANIVNSFHTKQYFLKLCKCEAAYIKTETMRQNYCGTCAFCFLLQPPSFQGDGASNDCTSFHLPAALRIHRQTASFLLLKSWGQRFKGGQNTRAVVIQSTHPILNKTFQTNPSTNDVGYHLWCTFIPHHSLHCLYYPLLHKHAI